MLARLDVLANRIGKQIRDVSFYLIDMGIAGEHLVLQAEEMGLGTCWIGWFDARRARRALDLPRKFKPVCLLSLGYFEEKPPREKKRKTLDEIVWFNTMKE